MTTVAAAVSAIGTDNDRTADTGDWSVTEKYLPEWIAC